MEINLALLHEMHPKLPADLVRIMVERAALALERNGHVSGVGLVLDLVGEIVDGHLSWPDPEVGKIDQHDHNRITEDGAEAVALAMVHQHPLLSKTD